MAGNDLEKEVLWNLSGCRLIDAADFAGKCYNGHNPPCSCACPFDLDVMAINKKIQKGNFSGAYSIYRDKVLFPSIVSRTCDQPCIKACVRKDIDDSVSMKQIERAITDYVVDTTPRKLNLPQKGKKVAVIGAGICGLSCTLSLATHGYEVTLYERNKQIGGNLWNLLPSKVFLSEVENQMQFIQYKLILNTEIKNIEEPSLNYDAVVVATGKNGESFGLLPGLNKKSLGSMKQGIFLAGGLVGAETPVYSIENGIRASQSIELYLQLDRMPETTIANKSKTSRFIVNKNSIKPEKRIQSNHYSKEEAIQEAARCIMCNCEECKLSCGMMSYYKKLPKGIVADAQAAFRSNSDTKIRGPRTVGSNIKRIISSCTNCGLCEAVCTEKINMGEFLLESRRIMHRNGTLPPAFHDYWLRDMKFAQGEKAYLAKNAPGCDISEYVFFPGCQLGASDPEYVEKPYAYLLSKNPQTGIIVGCCGVPAEWAGNEALAAEIIETNRKAWEDMGKPTAIFACPTCEKMFARHLPEMKQISLYDIIDRQGMPEKHTEGNVSVSVFDPCASRYDESMQRSVRNLIKRAGFTLEELPYREKTAQCCGYGGQIYSANPEFAESIARKSVAMGSRPYITYCTNCRDIFAVQDKSCRHVIDILFNINGEMRKPPSLTERRYNRVALRAALLKSIWKEEEIKLEQQESKLIISPELLEKLNKKLILEDDIGEVIGYCESTGDKLYDSKTGNYVGHLKQGILTYWVVYKVEGMRYRVVNAYSHRFVIEGE